MANLACAADGGGRRRGRRWTDSLNHFLSKLASCYSLFFEWRQAREDASRRGSSGGAAAEDGVAPATGPRQLRRLRRGPGLPARTHEAIVDLLIRLASTAQYSKVWHGGSTGGGGVWWLGVVCALPQNTLQKALSAYSRDRLGTKK